MGKVGAKKYDEAWWNDMMGLPKIVLVHALKRANKRADKAEESAPTVRRKPPVQHRKPKIACSYGGACLLRTKSGRCNEVPGGCSEQSTSGVA